MIGDATNGAATSETSASSVDGHFAVVGYVATNAATLAIAAHDQAVDAHDPAVVVLATSAATLASQV